MRTKKILRKKTKQRLFREEKLLKKYCSACTQDSIFANRFDPRFLNGHKPKTILVTCGVVFQICARCLAVDNYSEEEAG